MWLIKMPTGKDGVQPLIVIANDFHAQQGRLGSAVLQQETNISNSEDTEMQGRGVVAVVC